jgi:hypothetical protein
MIVTACRLPPSDAASRSRQARRPAPATRGGLETLEESSGSLLKVGRREPIQSARSRAHLARRGSWRRPSVRALGCASGPFAGTRIVEPRATCAMSDVVAGLLGRLRATDDERWHRLPATTPGLKSYGPSYPHRVTVEFGGTAPVSGEVHPVSQPGGEPAFVDLVGGDSEHCLLGLVDVGRVRVPRPAVEVDEQDHGRPRGALVPIKQRMVPGEATGENGRLVEDTG